MADGIPISQLQNISAATITGAEEVPLTQSGVTLKSSLSDFVDYFETQLDIADLKADSINWEQTYLNYNANYSSWNSTTAQVNGGKLNWDSTYNVYSANSGQYVKVNDADISSSVGSWVLDENGLTSNSDVKVPTQRSVKAYVDGLVTGVFELKGGYVVGTDTPSITGGVGILAGDSYTVTDAGQFYGTRLVESGDVLIASIDAPTTVSDWAIIDTDISFDNRTNWDSAYSTVSQYSAGWGGEEGVAGGTKQTASLSILATKEGDVLPTASRGSNSIDIQTGRFVGDEVATGSYSSVLGGYGNKTTSNADFSIAIGNRAYAEHMGSLVFSDSRSSSFSSLSDNTVNFKAENGLRLITDGNQVAGQVLTCDANGHGTWQTSAGGFVQLTQAEYDNLTSPDPTLLYIIIG